MGDAFGGRRKLNRCQLEAVRRIEKFLQAWIEVSPITPEVMGRTSGKVESLEEMLTELHEHGSVSSEVWRWVFSVSTTNREARATSACPGLKR